MESQDSQREVADRKRKLKFSTGELQVLVEEVVKHHTQLFGKQSLQVAEAVKRKTRLGIQAKVNAKGVTTREVDDLKKRWNELRIITKKKLAAQKKEASVTGEGRSRAPALTDLEQLVESTLEPESVFGTRDADSSARAATKQGESSRRTAQKREKRAPQMERTEDASRSAG
ncbi:t-SNARE domain-containing protein 1-like [Lissotriton helveticus]